MDEEEYDMYTGEDTSEDTGEDTSEEYIDGDEGEPSNNVAQSQNSKSNKVKKIAKKRSKKSTKKVIKKTPIGLKLRIIGLGLVVLLGAMLVLMGVAAVQASVLATRINAENMANAFAGLKVIYRANDDAGHRYNVTVAENLGLEMAVLLAGYFGEGATEGRYYIDANGSVQVGEAEAKVVYTLPYDISPSIRGAIYRYQYQAGKLGVLGLGGGYTPIGHETDGAEFDSIRYVQNVYKQIAIIALAVQTNQDILDVIKQDYALKSRALSEMMQHYGYTDDERAGIIDAVVTVMLGQVAVFNTSGGGSVATGEIIDIRQIDPVITTDLTTKLTDAFDTVLNYGEVYVGKYAVAPKFYIRDCTFEQVNSDGYFKINATDEVGEFVGIVYMPITTVMVSYSGLLIGGVQGDIDMRLRVQVCEDLSEVGATESARVLIEHSLDVAAGDSSVEINVGEIDALRSYVEDGLYSARLRIRQFVNNTLSLAPTLVSDGNAFGDYFRYINGEWGYYDVSTDFYALQFDPQKGQGFRWLPDSLMFELT